MVDLSVRMYHLEVDGKIEKLAPDLIVAHLYLQHRMPGSYEKDEYKINSFKEIIDLVLADNH